MKTMSFFFFIKLRDTLIGEIIQHASHVSIPPSLSTPFLSSDRWGHAFLSLHTPTTAINITLAVSLLLSRYNTLVCHTSSVLGCEELLCGSKDRRSCVTILMSIVSVRSTV